MKSLLPVLLLATSLSLPALAYEGGKAGHGDGHRGGPLREALAKLPPEKADGVRNAMKASYEKNKPLADKARAIADEKRTLLSAETFDKAAFEKKQAEERDVHAQMRAAGDEAFADSVAGLSASERKTVAEGLKHRKWGKHDDAKAAPGSDE